MSREKQSGDCKNRNSHIEEMAVTTCSLYREYFDKKCAGNSECDFNCHHYDRCEKLYEKSYRKQEWISVDERLPENYEHCLLFLDNETMEIGWYHEVAKHFVVGGLVTINRVTHWMPLPEAPKMKGGAE